MMTLNEHIKNERLKKGVTQEDLAEQLHLTQGYISQIEVGEKKPCAATVLKIEEILGLEHGSIWNVHNIVMDHITETIKILTPVELNEVDDYLRYLMFKRNNEQ
jgi:transcriptional regulator with XRE-family HTH domain